MKSKQIAGILVIIILGILIIINKKELFPIQNVATQYIEENNWITYENTKYGFEFKYPPNYLIFYTISSITEGTLVPAEEDSSSITLINEESKSQLFCCEPSTLGFNIVSKDLSIEEFIKTLKDNGRVKDVNKINFHGKSAYEIIGFGGFSSPYRTIIFDTGNNFMFIHEDSNIEIENQILNSFNFK
jgi:hypothetical protein